MLAQLKDSLLLTLARRFPPGARVAGIEIRNHVSCARTPLTRALFGLSARPAYQRPRRVLVGADALAAVDRRMEALLRKGEVTRLRGEIASAYEAPEVLFDYAALYSAKTIVELGTRMCRSTNALARAAHLNGGRLFSFDPMPYIGTVDFKYGGCWEFRQCTGEAGFDAWDPFRKVDLLFIDTDPHSFEQTMLWLEDTWSNVLVDGGLIMLDDANDAIQGIPGVGEVASAVERFVSEHRSRIEFAVIEANCLPCNGTAVIKLRESAAATR